MSTARPWLAAAAILLTAAACGGSRPAPTAVVLRPPADTVLTPYSEIARAIWLGGERWAVIAPRDGRAAIVEFGADSLHRLGRDSTELRNPATAFLLQDTLYINDWGLRRTTLWTNGTLARAMPASDALGGALPQARDAAGPGHWYAELAPPGGLSGSRDSAAVVRADVATGHADTVARLAPLDVATVMGDRGRRFERRVFSGNDRWGVEPDGAVWVARVYGNRVDWRSPDGTWRKGRALPDRVLEVTRYDRELFIRNFPKELRSMAQQLPFAPVKPPFEDAFGASDGTVWLVKSRAPADSAGRYHVVGRDGQLRRDLRVPGTGRVIGASGDAAIVAEPTRRGVRLLRFALPPVTREAAHDS